MDISINAEVHCTEGVYGRLTRVIVNPVTEEITHLVVKEGTFGADHVVPINRVKQSTPAMISLKCSKGEVEKFPPFTVTEYIEPYTSFRNFEAGQYFFGPYGVPVLSEVPLVHEMIPPGELEVHRGTKVEASDGYIGRVSEFLVVLPSGHISHLVLEEGSFWNKKDVTIPIAQVDHIEKDTVYLKLDKASVAALPAIPIHQGVRSQHQK